MTTAERASADPANDRPSTRWRALLLAAVAALCVASAPARAQAPPAPGAAPAAPSRPEAAPDRVTEHTLTLRGQEVRFRAAVETQRVGAGANGAEGCRSWRGRPPGLGSVESAPPVMCHG